MDDRQSIPTTPENNNRLDSRRALAAAVCMAVLVIVALFSPVPVSRLPVVPLFNPWVLALAGAAIAFGLSSAVKREALWPLGVISAALAAIPFVLQLFPAFRG